MISKFQLIKNIGVFDSVEGSQETQLAKLTLIYAENARGKTTLSAILRSLQSGEITPIIERVRLGAQNQPHVVVKNTYSTKPVVFQNNSWSSKIPEIIIFDDYFIDQNVCSGLQIEAGHRLNLHEVIVGAQGVVLAREIYELVKKIEIHNTELRKKAEAIPADVRGRMKVDEFCELDEQPDIGRAKKEAEMRLNALKNEQEVRTKSFFSEISLPPLEIDHLKEILSQSLPDLDTQALEKIKDHFNKAGEGSEQWIEQGMHRIYKAEDQGEELLCPFCAQNLKNSYLTDLYRVYFSEAYSDLIRNIDDLRVKINRDFGGDAIAEFQEKVKQMENLHRFWTPMCEMPKLKIDSAEIVKTWQEARDIIFEALTNKKSSPLEGFKLDKDCKEKIESYQKHAAFLEENSRELVTMNMTIRQIKEQASSGSVNEVLNELERLKATKKRFSPEISQLCKEYLAEKKAKKQKEEEKVKKRDALDKHRDAIFPKYQEAINRYLDNFNASFRVESVIPTNPRGRASCSYCLVINDVSVPLEAEDSSQAMPTFKNTLSSGDRSTLALAFFFASLEQDSDLSKRVVIIDDPVTSLDDYREISTTQEIQSLIGRAAQVIVLSHDKDFLCKIWDKADKGNTATLEVKRVASGSTITKWDIRPDTIEDYDIRHKELRKYNEENIGERDKIAQNIRFVLERYCRVGWPKYCPPGFGLGEFKNKIQQSLSSQTPILSSEDYEEFSKLIDYAHKFHHDTNTPAWEEEIRDINDGELQGFVKRTLEFTKPRKPIGT
jgi:wobble nucleotide-excising tRNase